MRTCLLLLTILLGSFSLYGQYAIHWVGGSGSWNDPNNWNTQTLPNHKSNVFINGANSLVTIPVNVATLVHSVELSADAELRVLGDLTVKSTDPSGAIINSESTLTVSGQLSISGDPDSYVTGYRGLSASRLIVNPGALLQGNSLYSGFRLSDDASARITGSLLFSSIELSSIILKHQVHFLVESTGQITIRDGWQTVSVWDDAVLENAGTILIDGAIGSEGIRNGNLLKNLSGGSIVIDDSGATALYNNGLIENWGDITIRSSGSFINILGTLHNHTAGSVLLKANNGSTGELRVIGEYNYIDNLGLISIQYPVERGIGVASGSFINRSGARVWVDWVKNNEVGISLDESYFENNGYIRVRAAGAHAIRLDNNSTVPGRPLFSNQNCGIISLLGGRLSTYSGEFNNHAWLFLKDPAATHIFIGGDFNNNGVVADRFGTLAGASYQNQGLVTRPLTGPLVANQPITNAFSAGSNNNLSSQGIYVWRNGPTAGTYTFPGNTFTPNSSAIGDSELWLRMQLSGCGSRWFGIPVDNAAPLAGTPPPNALAKAPAGNTWQVYPNPAGEMLQFTVPESGAVETVLQLSLHSLDGRVQYRDQLRVQPGTTISLVRPARLPAGTYTLRFAREGELPITRRVVWQ